jgi:hypothetical protein
MKLRLLAAALALTMGGSVLAAAPAATAVPRHAAKAPLDKDRAQALAWTRELETAPLAEDAPAKRAWLLQWVKDVRGLKVHVCDVFGVFGEQDKKVSSLLLQQYMFGSASYLIEHPSMDGIETAVQLAGVNSALNAYAAMRSKEPQTKVAHFDELLALQAQGGLYDYVESNVFSKCKKP